MTFIHSSISLFLIAFKKLDGSHMPNEKVVIDYTFKTNLIEGLIYTFKSARIRIKHVQKISDYFSLLKCWHHSMLWWCHYASILDQSYTHDIPHFVVLWPNITLVSNFICFKPIFIRKTVEWKTCIQYPWICVILCGSRRVMFVMGF